jgi:hypothetical protein
VKGIVALVSDFIAATLVRAIQCIIMSVLVWALYDYCLAPAFALPSVTYWQTVGILLLAVTLKAVGRMQ